uniref:Archaelysin family metallopeptidase 1 n=1 Tax=Ornithorhynchus anatinus TaxID=9258 RepID=A0A6I8NNW3_ORNAN
MLQCRHAQEFSFGPRALKDALISTDPALQDLYAKAFSKTERLFLSEAYNPQRTLFCTLLIRTAFDWLLSHPDAPEDFETFYYSSLRRKQSVFRKHIYLQPIDLSEGPLGSSLLGCLRSCVESFFLGLHVKCLPSIPVSSIPCCFRHNRDSDRIQLHAEVGVCSFARFSGDFSQAGPGTSEPALGAKDVSEVTLRERDRTLLFGKVEMVQCCKVTCHEICHLIGLGNCRWLRCVMQGALSTDEALLRPLELCPICLRKLQYAVGFKLIERYKKLYEWIQTLATTWSGRESADLSASEDNLPFSADSGMCCENDSEAVTSLSEPLTPDASNHAFSMEPELEPEEGLSSFAELDSQQQLGGAAKSSEIIKEYELWLTACIAALERDVSEEELARVDREVDALARWEMFTGQLPATRKDLNFSRDSVGLRKVLGDKFSSLRRKLSTRKLSKAEPSPHGWGWEEH